jgi:hypothetical protein
MTDENTDADVESGTDLDTDAETDRDIPDADVDDTAVIEDSSAPLTNNKRLRTLVFRVLPALVVLLGAGAGLLRWRQSRGRIDHRPHRTRR